MNELSNNFSKKFTVFVNDFDADFCTSETIENTILKCRYEFNLENDHEINFDHLRSKLILIKEWFTRFDKLNKITSCNYKLLANSMHIQLQPTIIKSLIIIIVIAQLKNIYHGMKQ